VIAGAGLVEIDAAHLLAGDGFDFFKSLEDGDAVGAAAAEVVDLAAAGVSDEYRDEAGDVEGMDVVSDLLALVAEDFVLGIREIALDEVA